MLETPGTKKAKDKLEAAKATLKQADTRAAEIANQLKHPRPKTTPEQMRSLQRESMDLGAERPLLVAAVEQATKDLLTAQSAAQQADEPKRIAQEGALNEREESALAELIRVDDAYAVLGAANERDFGPGHRLGPVRPSPVLMNHARERLAVLRVVLHPGAESTVHRNGSDDLVPVVVLNRLDDVNPLQLAKRDRRRLLRVREWRGPAPWLWNIGEKTGLPAHVVEDAIACGLVRRLTEAERAEVAANGGRAAHAVARPIRFLRREGPYNPGETATPDPATAERYVQAGGAEYDNPEAIAPATSAAPERPIAMRFLVSETPYGRGQVAGFGPRQAADYLSRGVAELVHAEDAARVKATPPPAPKPPPPDPQARITLQLLGSYDADEGGRFNRGEQGTFRIAEAERMLENEIAERVEPQAEEGE